MRLRLAWLSGTAVAACVFVLLADYVVASRRAPHDEQLVKTLRGPRLEAEHKRITEARLARRSRDEVVAWVLIASAAVFLACAKRRPLPHGRGSVLVRQREQSRDRKGAVLPLLDLAYVEQLVAQYGRGKESAILLLGAIQAHYRYLPDEALRRLCELTEITPAQIAGTSSFYAHFRRSPVGKHVIRVCHGTACHVAGARQVTEELRRYLEIPEGADTDAARQFTIDEVACLGCCSLAPVLMVDGQTAGRLTPASACDALKPFEQEPA